MKKTSYIKLIAVMIAMIMAFSIVSCSDAGETSTTESTTTKEDTTVETSDRLQDTESSEATEVQSEENTVEQTESKDADGDISIETTSEKATEEQSTETATEEDTVGIITEEQSTETATEEDTVGITTEEQSTETATEEDTMGITTEEQTTKKPEVDYEQTTEKANGGSENQTEQKEEPVIEYSPLNDPTNIITLNKDMEPLVIQGASGRSNYFKDKYVPLQFVHVADMHADLDNWNRMVEYVNYYSDYISFVMHAGDYVGGNQGVFVNMYKDGLYCGVPIFNCVGNHDTMAQGTTALCSASKERTHALLFGNWCTTWGVTFLDCDYSTAYYRDFPESNIRLIVLDQYYDVNLQKPWLKALLDEAKTEGYHVITVMHEPSDRIADAQNTAFHSINDWESLYTIPKQAYEDIISEFVKTGGILIANLAGHEHHDLFGYTLGGVLNSVVERGSGSNYWTDGNRVDQTRTNDAFNVVSVDTNLGIIKLIRIGNNYDNFLREKKSLCYDYINKRIVDGSAIVQKEYEHIVEKVDYVLTPEEMAENVKLSGVGLAEPTVMNENGVDFVRIMRSTTSGKACW